MKLHVDFTDFNLFINIAETNSLTRGAERTFLSAPAASVRIKHLEDSIGAKLLDRTSQGVTLTPSGQAFLHHARLVREQLENLRSELRDYAQGVKGHLRVVASPPAMLDTLPEVLRAYVQTHPNISVDLQELVSTECVRAVSDGTAQIGILGGPLRTESLEVVPYLNDRLALVTLPDHPLAAMAEVKFQDALEYEFVGIVENTTIYAFMRRMADARQTSLKTRVKVASYETLCRVVEAGIGIGVVSQRAAHRHAKGRNLKIIPLADAAAARELLICVRSMDHLSCYARDMVELLLSSRAGHEVPAGGELALAGKR